MNKIIMAVALLLSCVPAFCDIFQNAYTTTNTAAVDAHVLALNTNAPPLPANVVTNGAVQPSIAVVTTNVTGAETTAGTITLRAGSASGGGTPGNVVLQSGAAAGDAGDLLFNLGANAALTVDQLTGFTFYLPLTGVNYATNAGSATVAGTATTATGISGGALVTVTNIANGQMATSPLNATNVFGTLPLSALPGNVVTNTSWESFGMNGNGVKLTTCYTSVGSPVVTCTNASFTAACVGYTALVYNDISNISYSLGTIVTVNNSTNVTLSTNVMSTWSGNGTMFYGTNNLLALSNMLASANVPGMTYVFQANTPGIYMVSGPTFPFNTAAGMIRLYQDAPEKIVGGALTLVGSAPINTQNSPHIPLAQQCTTIYFVTPSAATATNALFVDENNSGLTDYGTLKHFFQDIQFITPANPRLGIYSGTHGGPSSWLRCLLSSDQGTNTGQEGIGFPYVPLAYEQNTNGVTSLVLPGPQNNGDMTIEQCRFTGFPIDVSANEHSFFWDDTFAYSGTAILVAQAGIGTELSGDALYFQCCGNALSMATNIPITNYQPIHFTRCGLEDHGFQLAQIYDPLGLFSGFFGFYNEILTNFTSPNLSTLFDAFNSPAVFSAPTISSAQFIGNGVNVTNLSFNNLATNIGTWQVPQTVPAIQGQSGYWHIYSGNAGSADFYNTVTANSGGANNGMFKDVWGSQWQIFQIRTAAPTIANLNNAESGMLWSSNGVWYASGSYDGSSVYTYPFGGLNGGGLTNLNAANLSGTVPTAQLPYISQGASATLTNLTLNGIAPGASNFWGVLNPTNMPTVVSNNQPSVTFTNIIAAQGGQFTGNGAGLTNVQASALTGTWSNAVISSNSLSANAGLVVIGNQTNTGILRASAVSVSGHYNGNGNIDGNSINTWAGANMNSQMNGGGQFVTIFGGGLVSDSASGALNGLISASILQLSLGTWTLTTNLVVQGIITSTNGYASVSNSIPVAVSVTASPFFFTNTTANNIFCDIDASSSITFALAKNGVTIVSSQTGIAGEWSLKIGDVFGVTYSGGTPSILTNRW